MAPFLRLYVYYPGETPPDRYFETRYKVLREPLGAEPGSERIAGDESSIHVWTEVNGKVTAVGRAHLLTARSDGSVADPAAQGNAPVFPPLNPQPPHLLDDLGHAVQGLRPAFQVRMMGSLPEYRGKGHAAIVLRQLEARACSFWASRTGWLQARTYALGFYQKSGWACFGPEYDVNAIGLHRSMWKLFAAQPTT